MPHLRVCAGTIHDIRRYANSEWILTAEKISNEYFRTGAGILRPVHVSDCRQPAPEKMFHENYAFFASTSHSCRLTSGALPNGHGWVPDRRADPFVVEIGSNDGIMLRNIKERGFRHLGVEPSRNVADVAVASGVQTLCEFFSEPLAEKIVANHGKADVVLAANVLCHIPDLPSVAAGFRRLLKPDGMLMFEDPYLGDMIAKTSYDQIYDEHVFLFLPCRSVGRSTPRSRIGRRYATNDARRLHAICTCAKR